MISLLFCLSVSNFFPDSVSVTSVVNNGDRLSFNSSNYHILSCLFKNLNNPLSNGGGIYIYSNNSYILVENSLFEYCTAPSKLGGAIWAYSFCISLNMVCGVNCSAYRQQFAEISGFQQSKVFYTSYSHCAFVRPYTGDFPLCCSKGEIECTYINSSRNSVSEGSGIRFTNGIYANFSYSTVANNHAQKYICIWYDSIIGTSFRVNVFSNTQTSSDFSTYYSRTNSNIMIEENVISGNTGGVLFSTADGGIIRIKNSYSSYFSTINYNWGSPYLIGTVTFISTKGSTKSHVLSHFGSYKCYAHAPYTYIEYSSPISRVHNMFFVILLPFYMLI